MKQIYKIVIVSLIVASLSSVYTVTSSDTTVTGSFTATGTLDVDVNNTSPDFGSISAGNNKIAYLQVQNNGNVTADVTQDDADHDSGNLAIGTYGSLGSNEYAVRFKSDGGTGSWIDIGTTTGSVIASNLAPAGTQDYNLEVTVSSTLTYTSDANQFSVDVSIAASS